MSKRCLPEFDVSDAFLIKMYKPTGASLTEHVDNGNDDEEPPQDEPAEEVSAAYLVKPMRLTTTVVKFSGTLGSTTRSDLQLLTITAYAHYVAEQTACRYIFADIQGTILAPTPIL